MQLCYSPVLAQFEAILRMSKPKIYATHPLFEPARKLLEPRFEMEYWRGPARPPRNTLLAKVTEKDALICLLTEKINDELLAAAPRPPLRASPEDEMIGLDVSLHGEALQ